MLIYFNRPLILEQAIRDALIAYFDALKVSSYYKQWSINITNDHPFSLMLPSFTFNASIFPSIIVSTTSDSKPSQLADWHDIQELRLVKEDLPKLEQAGYMVNEEIIKELEETFKLKEQLIGVTKIIRRQEKIAIEIWSENNQLKNELYEQTRLFLAGGIHEAMIKYRENNNFDIFDHTIQGDRSGNYNYDFGVTLFGARLTFDADYFIEQSVIETQLAYGNNHKIIWEAKEYVKR